METNDWHSDDASRREHFEALRPPNLPLLVRLSNTGIMVALSLIVVGKATMAILRVTIPNIDQKIPLGMWTAIWLLIWIPGLFGLVASLYTVARYPYLSLITGGGPKLIENEKSWVWWVVGAALYLAGTLVIFAAAATESTMYEVFVLLYLALLFFYGGFLATFYRRTRHVTVATFMELTHWCGFPFFPLYIPTLVIGSIRYRRFLASLEEEHGIDAADVFDEE